MRQLILATSLASAGTIASASNKAFGFAPKGSASYSVTTSDFKDFFNAVLRRTADKDKDIFVPISKHNFTYSKLKVVSISSATSVAISLADVSVVEGYEYTIVFVRKGHKFNERSNYSFVCRAGYNETPASLATKIASYVNSQVGLNLSAVVSSSTTITFSNVKKDEAFEIKFADKLVGVKDGSSNVITSASIQPATYDSSALQVEDVKKYVADLMSKAAADAGFEYTYRENDIYPGFFGDQTIDLSDYASGAFVYTLSFAEPRQVKTIDDAVRQVVQVVLPSSVTVTSLDTLLASFGTEVA